MLIHVHAVIQALICCYHTDSMYHIWTMKYIMYGLRLHSIESHYPKKVLYAHSSLGLLNYLCIIIVLLMLKSILDYISLLYSLYRLVITSYNNSLLNLHDSLSSNNVNSFVYIILRIVSDGYSLFRIFSFHKLLNLILLNAHLHVTIPPLRPQSFSLILQTPLLSEP